MFLDWGNPTRKARFRCFTKEKETADECIERLVGEFSHRRRKIYVATSDLIERRDFARGALRLSARELLNEVEQSEREVKQKITKEQTKSRNTLDGKPPDVRQAFERWRRE